MKILYLASERSRAQVATRALRTVYPHINVLWGSNFERAAFTVLENPDLAALIAEVQSDSQGCVYLKQLHRLELQAPVVMVLPEGAGSPVESLKAGANGYVAKGPSFSQELSVVLSRTIGGGQAPAESAVGVPVDRQAHRDCAPAGEVQRPVPDLEASSRQEQHSTVERSAAAGHQAKLEMLLRQEREVRTGLEQKLTEAQAALQGAEQRHLSAAGVATAQLAERQTQYEAGLSRAASTQKMLEEQLRQSRQSWASALADIERLTRRNSELSSMLTETTAKGSTLERRLAEIEAALAAANERTSRDQASAAGDAAAGHAALHAQLEREVEKRRTVEDELARAKRAQDEAEQQRTSAVTAATALWAERQAQFDAELAKAAEARSALGVEARELETALREAREAAHSHAAKVEQLTQREAELTSQLAEATAARDTLERQLTDTAERVKEANEGASRNRLTAATRAAERELELEGLIDRERATRADLEQRLAQLEATLREAEQRASDMKTPDGEVERLTQREADLTSQLAETAAIRSTLERQLADAATAVQAADEGARRDHLAANTRAAEREIEFDRLMRHEHATRADVEQRLAEREEALREAEQRYALAMTAAATERAERQAQFDAELSQAAAMRDEFQHRLSEADSALAAARENRAAVATEIERLTRGETELTSQLAEAAAIRSTLEQQLIDATAALSNADEAASRDRVAAEARAAEREAEFDRSIGLERAARADVEERLAKEITHREALDYAIAEMHSAAADAERRLHDEIATLTTRAGDERTQLENHFATERDRYHERQAELLTEIQNLETRRAALEESLTSIREHAQSREIDYQHERDGLEQARLTAETEVGRLAAELAHANQNLEEARRDFQQTLDRVSSEHAGSRATLVATVAERDARIEDVETQLVASTLALRQRFQLAPLPLWRCTRNGALTEANRALADLVGSHDPDALRGADFVKAVFESTDDLSWLIERTLSTRTRQSVETAWKRDNGERLDVRLSATELDADTIEIAVENVTAVRILEDRLARAHRIEAVGRLASEIALTCGRLLRDVHEDGQQWLMAVSADTAVRRRGERLLGEVTRAASYLERLAAHGDEQASALKPVELNRVLGDLKPVLKHVAGDDVDLELSKTSSPLTVDLKGDRVERLLVNLASYGRERMPAGGRLKIELATVVVDQKFIADHPNVRRGHHALITVTAVRRTMPTTGILHIAPTSATPIEVVAEKPGVDLGALQELLQECGGHLWLTADPPGNMVVKIRLPLRVWDDQPHSTTSVPTDRKRVIARWFRH